MRPSNTARGDAVLYKRAADDPARIRQIVKTLGAYKQRTGQEAHFMLGGPLLQPELVQELAQEFGTTIQEVKEEQPEAEQTEQPRGIRALMQKLY